jgi:hypothetical protein
MESQEHFDILIIGAGISGIDAAYHLQTTFPGKTYGYEMVSGAVLASTGVARDPRLCGQANHCHWKRRYGGFLVSHCDARDLAPDKFRGDRGNGSEIEGLRAGERRS